MADDFVSNSLVLPSGLHHRDGTTGWPWRVEDQLPSDRPSDRRLLHAFLLGKSRGVVDWKIIRVTEGGVRFAGGSRTCAAFAVFSLRVIAVYNS